MKKVCCQLSPFSHVQVRGDLCTNQVQICLKNGNQVATRKTSESGFSWKDKKSKFLLTSDLRSRSTNFKPILTEEASLTGIIDSQQMKLIIVLQGVTNPREISYYFKKNYQNKIGLFVKQTRIRNMRDMDELQKSHVLKVELTFKK